MADGNFVNFFGRDVNRRNPARRFLVRGRKLAVPGGGHSGYLYIISRICRGCERANDRDILSRECSRGHRAGE